MNNLALLFAGQGAQKTGMGESLYNNVPAAKEIFERAEKIHPGIIELCFHGEQDVLNQTIITQPAVFTADAAAYAAFASAGIPCDAMAGFSLGEYAALYASGALSFEDAMRLVEKRAQLMQTQAEKHDGGMAAVLVISAEETEKLADQFRGDGVLEAVNYNCPGQTVVAGDTEKIDRLAAYCKENKIRLKKLPVNGAFHSAHMKSAADQLQIELESMTLGEPNTVLYANRTGKPYQKDGFQKTLAEQTSHPVLFEQIIRDMLNRGYDTFVELGPGKTLSGFVGRIDKQAKTYHISDFESYEQTIEALKTSE